MADKERKISFRFRSRTVLDDFKDGVHGADVVSNVLGEALGRAGSYVAAPVRGFLQHIKNRGASGAADLKETRALHERVTAAFASTVLATTSPLEIANVIVRQGMECAATVEPPSTSVIEAFFILIEAIIEEEGLSGVPEFDVSRPVGIDEGTRLRNTLRKQERFLGDFDHAFETWCEKLAWITAGIIGYLPVTAFLDEEDAPGMLPCMAVSLIDLLASPAEVIERLCVTFFDTDVLDLALFEETRTQLDHNILLASGIPPEHRDSEKSLVLPKAVRGKTPRELVETYLRGTPFQEFFETKLPFPIPLGARFEHMHVLGGTGHGKTELLKLLIHHDLERLQNTKGSLVVMESQGDLIRSIAHLSVFSPESAESLADRLVLIDPNDVAYPLCLNLFDVSRERLTEYAAREREVILNGIVELYEYLFGALLGAELTQKQGLLFRYLARLLVVIPDATIHTLVSLMETPTRYRTYTALLDRASRSFFETQFADTSFAQTRKQILRRLWGVLATPTFERIFSHSRNSLDMFAELNQGKIILINTAKDLLKQEGSAILGRFFVAMIAQATLERSVLPETERVPTFVYLDEAHEYIDERIEELLNQARKYKVGLVMAHQHLDQLTTGARSSLMTNASIKFVGGVSAKDARALRDEMRTSEDLILGTQKREQARSTEFACFIKHATPQAVKVTVPLGFVASLPTLSDREYQALVARSRERYCAPVDELPPMEPRASGMPEPDIAAPETLEARAQPAPPVHMPSAESLITQAPPEAAPKRPEPPRKPAGDLPPALGRGGAQHKYLQELIKQAAEAKGFRAVIEEPILDGTGRVDVSLSRGTTKVACEISVTSTKDQELGNIEKCIAAGYETVVLVSKNEKQLARLRTFLLAQIDAGAAARVRFATPEEFVLLLDGLAVSGEVTEATVRGYKVRTKRQLVSDTEAQARKTAIASVIAKSLSEIRER